MRCFIHAWPKQRSSQRLYYQIWKNKARPIPTIQLTNTKRRTKLEYVVMLMEAKKWVHGSSVHVRYLEHTGNAQKDAKESPHVEITSFNFTRLNIHGRPSLPLLKCFLKLLGKKSFLFPFHRFIFCLMSVSAVKHSAWSVKWSASTGMVHDSSV